MPQPCGACSPLREGDAESPGPGQRTELLRSRQSYEVPEVPFSGNGQHPGNAASRLPARGPSTGTGKASRASRERGGSESPAWSLPPTAGLRQPGRSPVPPRCPPGGGAAHFRGPEAGGSAHVPAATRLPRQGSPTPPRRDRNRQIRRGMSPPEPRLIWPLPYMERAAEASGGQDGAGGGRTARASGPA